MLLAVAATFAVLILRDRYTFSLQSPVMKLRTPVKRRRMKRNDTHRERAHRAHRKLDKDKEKIKKTSGK